MLCENLWEQDKKTYKISGCELRYLRYIDYLRAMDRAGISPEFASHCQHLSVKQLLGTELTDDEFKDLQLFQARYPTMEMSAACFLEPRMENAQHLRTFIYSLAEEERSSLDLHLRELIKADPSGYSGFEYAAGLAPLGVPLSRTLEFTTITLQQAVYLSQALETAKKKEEQ